MEHQHPATTSIGSYLEAGPMRRERVWTNGPGAPSRRRGGADEPMLLGFGTRWVEGKLLVVAVVVVEDHLEQPVRHLGWVGGFPVGITVWRPVAVPDGLQETVGRAHSVALIGSCPIDV